MILLPPVRRVTARLASLATGTRFSFRSTRQLEPTREVRYLGLRGEVIGPGPNGGVAIWEISRAGKGERRRWTEWSGAVYVYPE